MSLAYTFQQYAEPAASGLTLDVAGGITPSGALTNELNANSIDIAGSITPDGNLAELLIGLNDGQLEGGITPAGNLALSLDILVLDTQDGEIIPSGALNLQAHIKPAGGITPVGALKMPDLFHVVGGAITPSGALANSAIGVSKGGLGIIRRRRR